MLLAKFKQIIKWLIDTLLVSNQGLSSDEIAYFANWRREYVEKISKTATIACIVVLFGSLISIHFLTPEPQKTIQLSTHLFILVFLIIWRLLVKLRKRFSAIGFVVIEIAFAIGYSRMIAASFAVSPPDLISVTFASILYIAISIFCLLLYPLYNGTILLMAMFVWAAGVDGWSAEPFGKLSDWKAISGWCIIFAVVMFYGRVYRQRGEALAELAARKLLIQAERRRVESVEKDLVVAGEIQDSFAPTSFTYDTDGLEVRFYQKKLAALGGDWSGMRRLTNGDVVIVVADATGKGVQAALVIQALQALWAMALPNDEFDPKAWIESVNRTLITLGKRRDHTMTMGLVVASATRLQYYSAGHLPLFLICRDANDNSQNIKSITSRGNILGFEETLNLQPVTVDLKILNALSVFLGTDGVFDKGGRVSKKHLMTLVERLDDVGTDALDDCAAVDDKLLVWIRRAA